MIHWQTPNPPKAPFFASIFNYYLSSDLTGYEDYDEQTLTLVKQIPGFLGYENMRKDNRGTFISYWENKDAIEAWSNHPIHQQAKELGRNKWYSYYHLMIAEVNRFHSHTIPAY